MREFFANNASSYIAEIIFPYGVDPEPNERYNVLLVLQAENPDYNPDTTQDREEFYTTFGVEYSPNRIGGHVELPNPGPTPFENGMLAASAIANYLNDGHAVVQIASQFISGVGAFWDCRRLWTFFDH